MEVTEWKKEHESIFILQEKNDRGGYWCDDTLFPVLDKNEATLFTTKNWSLQTYEKKQFGKIL